MFYDFDKYPLDMQHVYGGHAAQKVGVLVNGEPYMLKYPTNLKSRDIKNSELSYSNSPYSEYIGSHIYGILGMPVHETLIGQRKGKTVVACKNFCEEGERLMMFSELKTTFEPIGVHSDSITEGSDTDLQEVLQVLDEHPLLEFNRALVKCRFWNMFVIDAYIGNPDRNNENWGLIATGEDRRLAPVYDNGNCLSDKWDENKIMTFLKGSEAEKKEMAFSIPSIFTAEDKRIYPLSFIAKKENEDCNQAVLRVVDRLIKEQDRINDFINNVPGLSAKAKSFYAGLLDQRYSKGLLSVYKELYKDFHGKQFGAKAHLRGGRG
jgi:hypothetical protein